MLIVSRTPAAGCSLKVISANTSHAAAGLAASAGAWNSFHSQHLAQGQLLLVSVTTRIMVILQHLFLPPYMKGKPGLQWAGVLEEALNDQFISCSS